MVTSGEPARKRIGIFYVPTGVGIGIIRGVRRYCREARGVQFSHQWVSLLDGLDLARAGGYEGVIGQILDRDAVQRVQELGIPVVNVANSTLHLPVPSVVADHRRAGQLAAEHLLRTGLRHVAGSPTDGHEGLTLRWEAFRERAAASGCAVTLLPHDFGAGVDSPEIEARDLALLRSLIKPVGLFLRNDLTAEAVLVLARRAGVRVPTEVAVLSFDNDPEVCEYSKPTLTSVDLDLEQIGLEAARLLDGLMSGRPAPAAAVVVAPKGLVARESTDVLAYDDPEVRRAVQFIRDQANSAGLSVDQVARRCSLSRRTLERRFRTILGRSVGDEIVATRMATAEELLLETTLPLREVARRCGFRSQGYFTRVVRRHFGRTPAVLRSKGR